jgi:hypothetical protein
VTNSTTLPVGQVANLRADSIGAKLRGWQPRAG